MRRQHDPRSGALLRSRPDVPGAIAGRVAARLAGEAAHAPFALELAEVGPAEAIARQGQRLRELDARYRALVAGVAGNTEQDAREAERIIRAAQMAGTGGER